MIPVPRIRRPSFKSILVTKQEHQLRFLRYANYETRNESVMRLIRMADQKYDFPDFDPTMVCTEDIDMWRDYQGLRVLSFSTATTDYGHVCPDFVFDHWKQIQLEDYEDGWRAMVAAGDTEPETNMLGWRGGDTHPTRQLLIKLNDKLNIDAELIAWDRSNPERLTCTNYVSLPDHARKWRYLIDVEGEGFSGRVKLLLFSQRVLFLVERPYKEWYFPLLKPWEHYVPVSRDMTDLIANLEIVKNDVALENWIRNRALEFAQTHLTRDAALARWNELLG